MMGVTIKDIAKQAGVSPATVSRVLANKAGFFGAQTAQKVRQTAKELGYRKNTAATELVTQRSHDLAVIVNTTKTNFATQIIEGIQATAFPADLNVIILYAGDGDAERQRRALETVIERSVRGILLLSVDLAPENLALLQSTEIPYCFLSISFEGPKMPFITSDDWQVGYQATKYLLERGHRRIGLAAVDTQVSITVQLREAGYRQALAEAGITPRPAWIHPGDYSYPAGQAAMQAYGAHPDVTAVLAGSDLAGIGVMNQARMLGLMVPVDLSVMSVDGTDLCDIVQPQLTSLTQSFYDMGVAGVKRMLATETPQPQRFTPIQVVARDSVVDFVART